MPVSMQLSKNKFRMLNSECRMPNVSGNQHSEFRHPSGLPGRSLERPIDHPASSPHCGRQLRRGSLRPPLRSGRSLVGVAGIEPATSSLSGTHSNRLSYTPVWSARREQAFEALPRCHPGAQPPGNVTDAGCAHHNAPEQGIPARLCLRLRRGTITLRVMVEATGFEPVTPSLQSSCSAN